MAWMRLTSAVPSSSERHITSVLPVAAAVARVVAEAAAAAAAMTRSQRAIQAARAGSSLPVVLTKFQVNAVMPNVA
jgi:hypothetical protein